MIYGLYVNIYNHWILWYYLVDFLLFLADFLTIDDRNFLIEEFNINFFQEREYKVYKRIKYKEAREGKFFKENRKFSLWCIYIRIGSRRNRWYNKDRKLRNTSTLTKYDLFLKYSI